MRYTKGKLVATALVLSTVFGMHHCSGKKVTKPLTPKKEVKEETIQKADQIKAGKKTSNGGLVTCMLDSGEWEQNVKEGDILLPRRISGASRVAGIYMLLIKEVNEDGVIVDVSAVDKPGKITSLKLKFGEVKDIGVDETLEITMDKMPGQGMVKVGMSTEDFSGMGDYTYKDKKINKPVLCAFTEDVCSKTVGEGNVFLDLGIYSMFKTAGIGGITVEKIDNEGIELEITPKKKGKIPYYEKIKFGETRKIGEIQKLDIYVEKGLEESTAIVTIETKNITPDGQHNIVDCIFYDDACIKEVQEGNAIFGLEIDGPFDRAEVQAIEIKKINAEGVEIDVRMIKNPEWPINIKLKFGERKPIGVGENLNIKVATGNWIDTVEVTLKTTKPIEINDELDAIVYCMFEGGKCTKEVREGAALFGFEVDGPFDKAGVQAIKVKEIRADETELDIHMTENPGWPINLKLKFGESKNIGIEKKLRIGVDKGAKEGRIKIKISEIKKLPLLKEYYES